MSFNEASITNHTIFEPRESKSVVVAFRGNSDDLRVMGFKNPSFVLDDSEWESAEKQDGVGWKSSERENGKGKMRIREWRGVRGRQLPNHLPG